LQDNRIATLESELKTSETAKVGQIVRPSPLSSAASLPLSLHPPFLPQMRAIGDLEERIHRQNEDKAALLAQLSEEKESLKRCVDQSALDKVSTVSGLLCWSADLFLNRALSKAASLFSNKPWPRRSSHLILSSLISAMHRSDNWRSSRQRQATHLSSSRQW
jgi:hypothetical protein